MPTLPKPNLILLCVEKVGVSTKFYADLLGHWPGESSPTLAMFPLLGSLMLGLGGRKAEIRTVTG